MADIFLVIPAYNPDQHLITLITNYQKIMPEGQCIVVNDGSSTRCTSIFNQLSNVIVLTHPHNQGKGAALKTAMNYVLSLKTKPIGIITADADGQHAVEDIVALKTKLQNAPHALHLGIRRVAQADVPLKSRIGNQLTRFLFNALTKNTIEDTQTGLRGIPHALMRKMVESKACGYEFEFEMFFVCKAIKMPIIQTPIQTIYYNKNALSHFNPVWDSLKIYRVFFKHLFSLL